MHDREAISHHWKPLTDLPEDHSELAHAELRALISVWEEQRSELQNQNVVKEFNTKLLRRWAVETGIIERLYTLDRGITELLVEHGLEASLIPQNATEKNPEVVISIIRDQHAAVEGLFDFVASRRELSTSYVKELHAVLTRSQEYTDAIDQFGRRIQIPLRRGDYKQRPNNPRRSDGSIHEYCPPEHVEAEMDRLIQLHLEHVRAGVSPEVEAAWLHHRFTQIHPFQDGNGRVARSLATLVVLRAGWLPLVVTNDHRIRYIDALEAADGSDLQPLVDLFAQIEKKAFLAALSVAEEVMRADRRVDHVIGSLRDLFQRRAESLRNEWDNSKTTASRLHTAVVERLERVADELKGEIGGLAPPGERFQFFVDSEQDGGERGHWFRYQLIGTARTLGYYANFSAYHAWARLVLDMAGRAEILVSFHGVGHDYRGLLVGSASFYRREVVGDEETTVTDVIPLTEEPFQINYKEPADEAAQRFGSWLETAMITGLELVRRSA